MKSWEFDDERSRAKLNHLIDEYVIGPHSEQKRAVLKLCLLRGKTYEETAELLKCSRSTVWRTMDKYADKLLLKL